MQYNIQEGEFWLPLNYTLETFMKRLQEDYKKINPECQLCNLPGNMKIWSNQKVYFHGSIWI